MNGSAARMRLTAARRRTVAFERTAAFGRKPDGTTFDRLADCETSCRWLLTAVTLLCCESRNESASDRTPGCSCSFRVSTLEASSHCRGQTDVRQAFHPSSKTICANLYVATTENYFVRLVIFLSAVPRGAALTSHGYSLPDCWQDRSGPDYLSMSKSKSATPYNSRCTGVPQMHCTTASYQGSIHEPLNGHLVRPKKG